LLPSSSAIVIMLLGIKITAALVVLHQQLAQAHGNHGHHHHHHDDEPKQHDHHSSLRSLENIFSNSKPKPPSLPPGQCKDGDPTFTLGGKTYQCENKFRASGGACRTLERPPEEEAIDLAKFKWWKEQKEKQKGNNGKGRGNGKNKAKNRRLGGCADTADCVDWDAQIITVPTYFHIIHDDNLGRKYTCDFDPDSAAYSKPFSDSSCAYIKEQMKVLNDGFRGRESAFEENGEGRSYPRYSDTESDTRIQFCLSGTTVTNDQSYYENKSDSDLDMKKELDVGGMETLNVYVNTCDGGLGYAYYPQSNDFDNDGVVILNDSMPAGGKNKYDEGDTLTHEVGHWLNLKHTHSDECDGPGDYMDLAGQDEPNREDEASYDCPVNLDNCSRDGGINPIHNFMAYTQDNCMDEFTPGQKIRMQSAWETYRHEEGVSHSVGLADDGITCCTIGDDCSTDTAAPTITPKPTPFPTTAAPTEANIIAKHDSNLGVPKCSDVGVSCSSGNLLENVSSGETNDPNTLDGCNDGAKGSYENDESIEDIKVSSIGGKGRLEMRGKAEIEATVFAYDDGSDDTADFYYAADANDLSWQFIASISPTGGKRQQLKVEYTLPDGDLQAVRVNFRYSGSKSPCSGGSYDDADDLVFAVADVATLPPTNSPTDQSSKAPTEGPTTKPTSNPTGKPSKAPIGTFTADPTKSPTGVPTQIPTNNPTPPPTSEPTKKDTKKRNRRLQKSLLDQFKGSMDKAHEDAAGEVQD